MERLFVKARLKDNKIGIANDPGYKSRLEGAGSPTFIRAIKEGDWSVIEGAFFFEFAESRHVIAPMNYQANGRDFAPWTGDRPSPFQSAGMPSQTGL